MLFLGASYIWIVPVALCVCLFYWLKVLRWQRILAHTVKASANDLYGPMMIGFAANNLFPVRLGEVVRVYLAAKRLGASNTVILASVVIERLLDLLAILSLLGIGLLWVESDQPIVEETGVWLALSSSVIFMSLLILTSYTDVVRDWLSSRLSGRGVFGQVAVETVDHFLGGLGILRRKRSFVLAMGNSIVQWGLLAVAIAASCTAIGIDVPFAASLICLAMVTFAIMLPAAPGFFGVVELAFVLALKPFGVSAEMAVAAAFFYHLTLYFIVTSSGILCLRQFGYGSFSFMELRKKLRSSSHH